MKIKTALLLISIIIAALLSGCSIIGADNTEIMRPPKATGDKAEIQKVIDETAGGNYIFKYPQTGENRSAIIMKDLDGDGKSEAIVFYRISGNSAAPTNLLIIAEKNGAWEVVGKYEKPSTEVNKIAFADMNSDGQIELITGWGALNNTTNKLSCYTYNGKGTNEILIEETYSSFYIGDFTNDGTDQILILSLYSADNKASAKLLNWKYDNNTIFNSATINMDPDITKYSNILCGDIAKNQYAAVIDGMTSIGTYNTQIIYYDSNKSELKNAFYSTSMSNPTLRDTLIYSEDFNNDGIIEIPVVTKMNYEKNEDLSTIANQTVWSKYNTVSQELEPVEYTLSNTQYGYGYKISTDWLDQITVRVNTSEKSITFYKWEQYDSTAKKADKLLTLRVFMAEEWLTGGEPDGYTLIQKNSQYAYAYSIPTGDSSLIPTQKEVLDNFILPASSANSPNTAISAASNKILKN